MSARAPEPVDDVDRAILARLRADARSSNAEVGAAVDLSEGAIRHRLARMIADGDVLRFTVVTRPLGPEGLVLVRCRPGATPQVVERMRTEGSDLFETSGEFDLAVSVEAPTMESFNRALDRIRSLPGVESTTTLVRLTRYVGDAPRPAGKRATRPASRGTPAPPRRRRRSRPSAG